MNIEKDRVFKTLAVALPILAIAGYFSGWWYRNEYFHILGIPHSSMATSNYTIFVHSFSVITKLPKIALDVYYIEKILIIFFVFGPIGFLIKYTERLLLLIIRLLWRWKSIVERPSLWSTAITLSNRNSGGLVRRRVLFSWMAAAMVFFLFVVSKGAGRVAATEVITNPMRELSTVQLILDSRFWTDYSDAEENTVLGELARWLSPIEVNEVGLIWRDEIETIVMTYERYDPKGGFNQGDSMIFRISNDRVVSVYRLFDPTNYVTRRRN